MRPDDRQYLARSAVRERPLPTRDRARLVPQTAPKAGLVPAAAVAMLRFAAEPPLLPRRLRPRTAVESVAENLVLPILEAVLDRIDVTQLILDHVSLPRILDAVDVDGVVARVNISPIIDRVLAEVDLPGLVRSSSDSLFSDVVLGVRLESASGDEMVDRAVGRILRRGGNRPRNAVEQGVP